MTPLFRQSIHLGLAACLTLVLLATPVSTVWADDCRRVPNILVLFDASGYMKEKDRYQLLLQQMGFFEKAMPLTADGLFNVGLRHYGLKVGMECDNTESILAIQPWDPQKFINAFPKTVSYGTSSLSAGLRAAADELTSVNGKSVIVLVGGGVESCKVDPVKITQQVCANNPDLEIHTFQVGTIQEGKFFLEAIAKTGRGTYNDANTFRSSANWYAWMRKYLLVQCGPPTPAAGAPPAGPPAQAVAAVTFDNNSFSVRSKDRNADAQNLASLNTVAQVLAQNPSARVVLHGFSDGKGSPQYNFNLSRKRAEAVARYLTTTSRIPASRISIVAHGSTTGGLQLPGPASDRIGRRVEFEILQ